MRGGAGVSTKRTSRRVRARPREFSASRNATGTAVASIREAYGGRARRLGYATQWPVTPPSATPSSLDPYPSQQGSDMALAQIGVTGLAVMGRNLARNFARNGFAVAVHNRSPEKMHSLIAEHGDEGTFIGSETLEDFVASLEKPRKIVIMVQAGGPTDAVIDALVPLV